MEACAAQSIVCISNSSQWLEGVASSAQAAGASAPNALSWEQFDSAPMEFAHPNCWAYAFISEGPELLPELLNVRLGGLCRSFPFGVLLEIAADVDAPDQQLFSHGFQKLGDAGKKMAQSNDKHHFLNSEERCFKFRLEEYKAVPDWLNAKFWAHPERFNL